MIWVATPARLAAAAKRKDRVPFTCPECGDTVMMQRAQAAVSKYCKRGCYISSLARRKGAAHPSWRGGRRLSHGYVLLHLPAHPHASPRGYVYEHVLVASTALGKPLPAGAEVHHVNGRRDDNRPVNLVICQDHRYHILLHARDSARKKVA